MSGTTEGRRTERDSRSRRRGLVLGAGGLLGASWSVGALNVLQDQTEWNPCEADVFMGTSVGSLLSLMLASGVSVPDLVKHQYGSVSDGPLAGTEFDPDTSVETRATLLGWPVGSPELLLRSLWHPFQLSPVALLAALCPRGKGSFDSVRKVIDDVLAGHEWPEQVNVVATNYDKGKRVLFTPSQRESVDVRDAVAASCAIPSWFPPVSIGGERYIDGSVASLTNVDLISEFELDEVYVVAPMAARSFDAPTSALECLDRGARVLVNRTLEREVEAVRRTGASVTVLAPCAQDLAVMGAGMMNPTRRLQVLDSVVKTVAGCF